MIGDNEQKYLLASDAGYGFVASLTDLVSRNKAGKAILRVPAGGKAVVPAPVPKDKECLIAAVSSIGRLLLFEMDELPELAKGKGNKLINIPTTPKYKSGEEKMIAATVVPEDGNLEVYTASRKMTIKWDDLDDYYGDRALRGSLLPKGWRKVERLAGIGPDREDKRTVRNLFGQRLHWPTVPFGRLTAVRPTGLGVDLAAFDVHLDSVVLAGAGISAVLSSADMFTVTAPVSPGSSSSDCSISAVSSAFLVLLAAARP